MVGNAIEWGLLLGGKDERIRPTQPYIKNYFSVTIVTKYIPAAKLFAKILLANAQNTGRKSLLRIRITT